MFDTSIPNQWIKAKLPEVADLNMGQSPSSQDVNETGEGIAFFQGKAEFGKLFPIVRKFCTAPQKIAQANDILLSIRAPVGPTNLADRETAIGRGLAAISVSKNNFNYKYLLHYFRSIEPWMSKQGTGTTFKAISGQFLKELDCVVPPLAEQKVIADKLDILLAQVDATKIRLERIPGILKALRQSVLAAAVSGKLTEEWRQNKEVSWITSSLANICRSVSDGDHQAPPKADTGIPFLVISNVNNGEIDFDSVSRWVSEDYYESLKDIRKPEINDILYTVTGSFGIPVIVNSSEPFCFQRHIAIIKPDHSSVNYKYLSYYLASPEIFKHADSVATGTAQKTVSLYHLRNFSISLPTIEEQTEIVRRIEELFALADKIKQKNKAALDRVNKFTQSILAKTFRGEFTADWRAANPDLISGENSAKALLEKIKTEREAIERQPKPKRSAIKKKTGSRMSKQIIKVVEALKQAGEPLSGQQLLAAAGYPSDSSTDQLEQFFLDLRDALVIEESIVKLERGDDSQDWFALAKPSMNKTKS